MRRITYNPYYRVRDGAQYQAAKAVCLALQQAGHEAYFVGGACRDLVIHVDRAFGEIDIATSARPEDVRSLFPATEYVGKAFGVCLVKVLAPDASVLCFEVATFRKEGGYSDRRRPDFVEEGTLEDDSRRRDFTMNALYFDPVSELMIDFHDGISHALAKTIRCVGVAEDRFREDALRIVRLFRFAANCFMEIESQTLAGSVKAADGLVHLSRERIVQECVKVHAGCFVDFSSTMFAAIAPVCFDENLPTDFEAGHAHVSWQESAHVRYPLSALAIVIAGAGCEAMPRFRSCVAAFQKWPGTRADLRLMDAMCAVFDFVRDRPKMSAAVQYLRWYKILELFRGMALFDVLFFLSAAAQMSGRTDIFVRVFLEKCSPFRENSQDIVEWIKDLISQSVTPEIRKSVVTKVSDFKGKPQMIGVWVGVLEMVALSKNIGMKIPPCLEGELSAEFISELEIQMRAFR